MSESTPPPSSKAEIKPYSPLDLSAGSAIAIVGVWIVGAAVTLSLFFAIFVFDDWADSANESYDGQNFGIIIMLVLIIWLISLPLSMAYKVTRMILGK